MYNTSSVCCKSLFYIHNINIRLLKSRYKLYIIKVSVVHMNNEEIINHWIHEAGSKEVIVVVGAGFSKNAIWKNSRQCASSIIPNWTELTKPFRNLLNDMESDSLMLFDYFRSTFSEALYEKMLLDSLHDEDIVPGDAHMALKRIKKLKCIITTNALDTLLDKTFPDARLIVHNEDISKSSQGGIDIIYLHGHRNHPDTWIFSRDDYDEFEGKFKIKFELAKILLAEYPSLFFGFSLTDPNLYLIIRFIQKNIKKYRPAMLSFAVTLPANSFADYWNNVGIKTILIDRGDGQSIDVAVAKTIEDIAERRRKKTIELGEILPGDRYRTSAHETFSTTPLRCQGVNGIITRYCDYHESRRKTEIIRLPTDDKIRNVGLQSAEIDKKSKIYELKVDMIKGRMPTGSWGLMASHRMWLQQAYKEYTIDKSEVSILLAGVGALPHFIDTTSLLFSINNFTNINMCIIDLCLGPICDIQKFFESNKYTDEVYLNDYYQDVLKYNNEGKLKVRLINEDMLNEHLDLVDFDIVLSHKTVGFLKLGDKSQIVRYAKAISKFLKKDGILVSAQSSYNDLPNSRKISEFQRTLYSFGHLEALNTEASFDIYDTANELNMIGETWSVNKEAILTVHRKIDTNICD